MNYFVITDTHFNNGLMVEACGRPLGFSEQILKNTAKVLESQKDTIVIHLGDVSFGNDSFWHFRFAGLCQEFGRCFLIKGNHDKKSYSWYYDHGWDIVAESLDIVWEGKKITFSHKPVKDNGYDFNVHGHFHNTELHQHEPELVAIKNDKQRLVVLEDNKYRPVSLKSILSVR